MRAAPSLLCVALALPVAACADPAPKAQSAQHSHLSDDGRGLVLLPGERAVVRIGADGALQLVGVKPTSPESALPKKPGASKTDEPLVEADPGTVAFTLGGHGDEASVLKVESGLDQTFDYRVRLTGLQAGKLVEMTVGACSVLPLMPSFEQWSLDLDQLVVSDLKTRATNEVVCPDTSKP